MENDGKDILSFGIEIISQMNADISVCVAILFLDLQVKTN
jgi:hypothetical protein